MIKLKVNDYFKVIAPLERVTINTLFAKAVVYQQVTGSVYVDSEKEPKVFYIAHPYGMSLLFGNTENEYFNENLFYYLTNKNKVRNKDEWLQVFPNSWSNKVETILDSYLVKIDSANMNRVLEMDDVSRRVVENTRVNFIFNISDFKNIKRPLDSREHEIVRTTKEMLQTLQGSVIPKYFWNHEDQFQNTGIGYSLIYDGEVASTAFSSCRFEKQLEIGIETLEKYRGKGFALYVCSVLINYCLENGLEPIWACRMENIASYQLAHKLGFIPTLFIPYYRLSV
ncbi:GNAT family N-acetyltransferase [Desulfosporosinus nitroreducens]|uniref:GNAT family N-acetyltransferase n=1 Tax=Desulfosporosinus nitroreducens TaxID=2018668 RepID=UPI00207C170D|nr:GNAT family N-acetyltransferase [Desulfosporosinus nitroreducens]MCO1602718.1 GNAT family N-acetyltransferase [Desulfosporosinus nitroreducens]